MDFKIDLAKRELQIENKKTKNLIIIKEFETIKKKFLQSTNEKYECELVFIEVKDKELKTSEIKPFARRKGFDNWLLEFNFIDFEVIDVE